MNKYYHNPNCTKSREGLKLLQESNIEFQIKEYLTEPLDREELKEMVRKNKGSFENLTRTNEELYDELGLEEGLHSMKEWVEVIIENPQLLQRPILLTDKKTIIGRPPENIQEFIDENSASE